MITKRSSGTKKVIVGESVLESEQKSNELAELIGVVKEMALVIMENSKTNYLQQRDRDEIIHELHEFEKRGLTVKMEQPQLDNGNIDPTIDPSFDYLFSSYIYFSEDPVVAEDIAALGTNTPN